MFVFEFDFFSIQTKGVNLVPKHFVYAFFQDLQLLLGLKKHSVSLTLKENELFEIWKGRITMHIIFSQIKDIKLFISRKFVIFGCRHETDN